MANSIILNSSSRVGTTSAEADDDFLFDCFVDTEAIASLMDVESPKMILLGSTGSGKTAVIRKISHQSDDASMIELDEIALDYLGNSDVIQFLIELGVSLDIFSSAVEACNTD